ncbi:hypothetical protein AXA84_0466 [Candidatus Phytoplasma oryzae]|uniref:DUF2963 domain-containing protein n=1 Tax=Candidatus Phytoplasma oryzae TaxID=203274 RepID=A0A139JQ85_9MOLU|nr:hypothetical protein [Candidatus Phytoplasma oryzae]KXT29024.1 hypothetical protein AXA84_0466 [Candidatus Phytoplasma oryzae]
MSEESLSSSFFQKNSQNILIISIFIIFLSATSLIIYLFLLEKESFEIKNIINQKDNINQPIKPFTNSIVNKTFIKTLPDGTIEEYNNVNEELIKRTIPGKKIEEFINNKKYKETIFDSKQKNKIQEILIYDTETNELSKKIIPNIKIEEFAQNNKIKETIFNPQQPNIIEEILEYDAKNGQLKKRQNFQRIQEFGPNMKLIKNIEIDEKTRNHKKISEYDDKERIIKEKGYRPDLNTLEYIKKFIYNKQDVKIILEQSNYKEDGKTIEETIQFNEEGAVKNIINIKTIKQNNNDKYIEKNNN